MLFRSEMNGWMVELASSIGLAMAILGLLCFLGFLGWIFVNIVIDSSDLSERIDINSNLIDNLLKERKRKKKK